MQFYVEKITQEDGETTLEITSPNDPKSSVYFERSNNEEVIYAKVGDRSVPLLRIKGPAKNETEALMYILQSLLTLDIWFDNWAASYVASLANSKAQMRVLNKIIDDALVIQARKQHTQRLNQLYRKA